MSMKENLNGRLRNASLPINHGLLPLFDAVVNSIHSIEEENENFINGKIKSRNYWIPTRKIGS
ncbi:MAG: hypothetical protein OXC72_02130 [Roseovarius sp.]|nr:hypothetical protein [Roseovarius sp.]